jgi:hypothetical protein
MYVEQTMSLGQASATRNSRATCCLQHSVMLPAETFVLIKRILTISPGKAEIERRSNFENL